MSQTPLYNAYTCFDKTDEEYIGTWFGFDVYTYKDCGRLGLLATDSDLPGEYSTFIFHEFQLHGSIGYFGERSVPMEIHLTETPRNKAFLLASMALFLRANKC